MEGTLEPKVIGKICPYCGKPGSVIYETKERIVFECPNGHQYEIKLRGSQVEKISAVIRFYNICFWLFVFSPEELRRILPNFPPNFRIFLNHGVLA